MGKTSPVAGKGLCLLYHCRLGFLCVYWHISGSPDLQFFLYLCQFFPVDIIVAVDDDRDGVADSKNRPHEKAHTENDLL